MHVKGFEEYAFGPFRFDPSDGRLLRDGDVVPLTPKTADLLLVLLESDGRLISKQELLERVWPSTFVEDGSLTFHIHQLRRQLGDEPEKPLYIETVARRGYKFVCPVARAARPPREENGFERIVPPSRAAWPRYGAWGAALACAAIAALLAIDSVESPPPRIAEVTQLTTDGRRKDAVVMVDRSRLMFSVSGKWYQLQPETKQVTHVEPLDAYELLAASPVREEFLARRPQDHGAEHGLWAISFDGARSRRIGSILADSASWSRDGSRIAYVWQGRVHVTDATGGFARVLTAFPGTVNATRWAPGDRYLRVDVSAHGNRTVQSAQYDVPLDGQEPTLVISDASDAHSSCGEWLPGSKDYVFKAGAPEKAFWILRGARGWLWRRPAAIVPWTFAESVLSGCPLAATNGSALYVLKDSEPRLSEYDASRRTFVPYLGGINAFQVSFSPDRRSVAYVTADRVLWRAHADGSQPRRLLSEPWRVDGLAWSPDGQRLAIRATTAREAQAKAYVLPADGGTPKALDPRDVAQGTPTWSNDGSRLAFGDVPETYGRPTGTEQIHVYDLRSGKQSEVPGSAGLWSARWSPDGRYLAATRIRDRRLMLFEVADGKWRDLRVDSVGDLRWSVDSEYIYVEPERPARWFQRVRARDGVAEPLLEVYEETLHFGAGLGRLGQPLFLRSTSDIFALRLDR